MHFEGAEFIKRTYTDDVWVPSDPGPEHVPDELSFGSLQFNSVEVESVLQHLDVKKGSGPDGIPPIILKNCASAFAKPLSLLFNRSLATSVFPDRSKVSYVTPIFKKGKRNNDEDYRGAEYTYFVLNSIEHGNQVDYVYIRIFQKSLIVCVINFSWMRCLKVSIPQDACG
jgi:hypothetical protein